MHPTSLARLVPTWISVLLILALAAGLSLPRIGNATVASEASGHCAGMVMADTGMPGDSDVESAEESRCAFPCTVLPATLRIGIDRRVQACPAWTHMPALTFNAIPPLQPPRR